ncbi:unnamed protein product [Rotaria sp. Silwood2]|nr:unnamed protein product [Rotaria sp. Silwood2]CAF2793976.1 unnamed protein product [Rotaria sp. Silwood2]CAF3997780.1 unnamed protein product [Rotaria sp. Silwood2]CAF4008789.1 unnamed protein product [Rotaria sp. Silwood2]CAF4013468.1 unnamed protein product [Rotaria sp. Silwood2]
MYPAPSQNLISFDDDSAGKQQFRLYIWLDTVTTYYLVVTTHDPKVTGQFAISATGIASLTFSTTDESGKNFINFREVLEWNTTFIKRWMQKDMQSTECSNIQ